MSLSVVSLFLIKVAIGEYKFRYLSIDGALYFFTIIWMTGLYARILRPAGITYGFDVDIGNYVMTGSISTFFLHLLSGLVIMLLIPLMTMEIGMPVICLCLAYKVVQIKYVSLVFAYVYYGIALLLRLSGEEFLIFLYAVTLGLGWFSYSILTMNKCRKAAVDIVKRVFASSAGILTIVISEYLLRW